MVSALRTSGSRMNPWASNVARSASPIGYGWDSASVTCMAIRVPAARGPGYACPAPFRYFSSSAGRLRAHRRLAPFGVEVPAADRAHLSVRVALPRGVRAHLHRERARLALRRRLDRALRAGGPG